MDVDLLREGPLEQAYRAYERTQSELSTLIVDNPEIFTQFFALVRQRNTAVERVKSLLRESAGYEYIGNFRRAASTKRSIDPETLKRMHPAAENLDGLFETRVVVNKAVLDGYVASGQLPRGAVDAATTVEEGGTRVYGPKTISGLDSL